MDSLEKYELVNKCETAEELSAVILKFTDPETRLILGRSRFFNGDVMAEAAFKVINENLSPNLLTREFGIRQQALYIKYYNK